MPRLRLRSLPALVALTALAGAAPAAAATGDTWTLVEHRHVPIEYYQGLTFVGSQTFFVGVFRGGDLTDASLRRQRTRQNLIPASVAQGVGFNHVGDPTYDAAGDRLLVGLECYRRAAAQAEHVRLRRHRCRRRGDARLAILGSARPCRRPEGDVAEVSPDGTLLWTSAGRDLIAYRTSDVAPANAARGRSSPPIRPVKRLRGAVPPSGANGAAFSDGKLLLAGSSGGVPQIWSVDVATGKRTVQVRLRGTRAEVEGIAVTAPTGGRLRWLLTPGVISKPTYGSGHSELLTFVPVNYRVTASASLDGATLTVRARLRYADASDVLVGATVRVGDKVARTDGAGDARVTLGAVPQRPLIVKVAKGRLRALTMTVRPRASTR